MAFGGRENSDRIDCDQGELGKANVFEARIASKGVAPIRRLRYGLQLQRVALKRKKKAGDAIAGLPRSIGVA